MNRVLRPYFDPVGVYLARPSLLRTKELPEGKPYKGGATTYRQMSRDVRRLLGDTNAYVTTLIDYYGLPADFPGLGFTSLLNAASNAATRSLTSGKAFAASHPRFHPFLALHELEAWIFAVPEAAEEHLAVNGLGNRLAIVAANAGGAERVNDGPATHPSIRLAATVQQLSGQRRYGKVADGPEIIAKAGLSVIRAACPHLSEWLEWLESLA